MLISRLLIEGSDVISVYDSNAHGWRDSLNPLRGLVVAIERSRASWPASWDVVTNEVKR